MKGMRGYLYDSISPDMPIIAAVFDAVDNLVELKIVQSNQEGTKFLAESLTQLHRRGERVDLRIRRSS